MFEIKSHAPTNSASVELLGDVNLKLKNSVGTVMTITLYNIRYVPSFIGNLFSIPTAMANGAEIRFINNKMEVQKNNDVFEFLPSKLWLSI